MPKSSLQILILALWYFLQSAGVTNLLVALANGVEAEERAKLIGEVRQIQENILMNYKMIAVYALSSKNT